MTFAEAVRMARRKSGLTQDQLAERAGLGRSCLAHIEQGHTGTTTDRVQALADALDVAFVYGRGGWVYWQVFDS